VDKSLKRNCDSKFTNIYY